MSEIPLKTMITLFVKKQSGKIVVSTTRTNVHYCTGEEKRNERNQFWAGEGKKDTHFEGN